MSSITDKITQANSKIDYLKEKFNNWKGLCSYLDQGVDTSLDTIRSIFAGLKSRITDLQNQIGSRDADIKNKDEQISRLKGDLLNRDKLIQELQDSNKPYLERIKYLEGELEAMATSKGAVVTELEKCKAQSPIEELTIGDVLILLFKKISPIKLK